jgi:ArsR family transcriptional regulator, arsenate/arsenite/antimonite-responsive transcriptional repressor
MPRQGLAVVGHAGPATTGDAMTGPHALAALAALGQTTRLEIFRLLIRREPEGLPAGALAEQIGCQQNTLSSHLSILARAGLVRGERDGRFIIYHANLEGMRALLGFLVMDCCDGHPELCGFTNTKPQSGSCCTAPPKRRSRSRK